MLIAAGFSACDDDKYEPGPVWQDGITARSEVALAGVTAQTIYIKAPSTPTLTSDAAWLHIGQPATTDKGIYTVELQADVNPADGDRTANIDVTAGEHKHTIKLTQKPGAYVEIKGIEPSETLDPTGGTFTVKYLSTAEPVITAPDWLTRVESRAVTEGEITFSYGTNTVADREGTIELTLTKTMSASITVSQAKKPLPNEMGSTATQLAAKMYAGINIGNTMECPNGEADWLDTKAKVNENYIAGLKAMGFNAVRIPCAWDSHVSDASTNTIDPAWLDRVAEVVGYIVGNDMYAVLNIHWDGGWLENNISKGFNEEINKKQHDYWTQIANKMNIYDEHLLLAAMNEPGMNGGSTGSKALDAIHRYQQTMLDAVRATGGNNATRVLIMQTPSTNIDQGTTGDYHMPTDLVEDRLMVEAHFYDPYQFNMMTEDADWGKVWWYWGAPNHSPGSSRNATNYEEDHVVTQMQKLKTTFVDKGIPAIIGEYCVCEDRSDVVADVAKHQASLRYWNRVVTREAKNAGCVPFFWETGFDINRTDGSVRKSIQLDGVMEGAAEGVYPF